MNKIKLTPVSALFIKSVLESKENVLLDEFIDQLDFSEGNNLINEVYKVCEWYDEIILNKKYFITNLIDEELSKSCNEHLIILLAAGCYPFAPELLEKHCEKINRIIEIDKSGMEEKQELYDRFFPECADKIKCISADILSKTVLDIVSRLIEEYYSDIPAIVLLDNATYFLKISDIRNIIGSFKSSGKKNTLILDSLRPFENVNKEKGNVPQTVFNKLKECIGAETITAFDNHALEEMFEEIGGRLKKSSNLMDMEKLRKGINTRFVTADDNWLQCSVWQI